MNIYVSGLSYRISDDDLRQLFEEYGAIKSAKVITDRETGRSRGFGFVEMSTDDEAKKAISELNGKDMNGRAIVVSEARPQQPRSGGFGGGGGGGGGYGNRSGGGRGRF